MTRLCAVPGCDRPLRFQRRPRCDMCSMHYQRFQKWGDPLKDPHDRWPRFWARVVWAESGCWIWQGSLNNHGYPRVLINGKDGYAHRAAYERLLGPIPAGLVLDHLCLTPACVNPWHLEPVTQAENNRRAQKIGHAHPNARRTCKRGHDWSVTSPYLVRRSNGTVTRRCRACQALLDRARAS